MNLPVGMSPGLVVSDPAGLTPVAPGGFVWVWPDAAARLAESPSQDFAGAIGFQEDIRAIYRLALQPSPITWLRLADESAGVWHGCVASPNTANGIAFVGTTQSLLGVPTAVAPTETNNATRLCREGNNTTAVPGNAVRRSASQGTTGGAHGSSGYRQFFRGVINNASGACPTMRWFMGSTTTLPTTNVDPLTFNNALGLGRTGAEANVQLIYGAAAPAVAVDLGPDFPHGMNEGYMLELYTEDGTEIAYQVTNLNTLAQVSGTLTTGIPSPIVNQTKWTWYATNNADAQIVSVDLADYSMWQQQYAL